MFGRAECRRAAFSLIEVTLALGIVAFALVALLGMLPSGLQTQQRGQEEASALTALNMAATAVRSAKFTGRSPDPTYALPYYFHDGTFAEWQSSPTQFFVSQSQWDYAFMLLPDGTVRRKGDTRPADKVLYMQFNPPVHEGAPARVYLAVGWPWRPADTSSIKLVDLKERDGFEDAVVVFSPRND